MLRSKARWSLSEASEERAAQAAKLAEELKLHPVVADVLVSRGYADPESAGRFLRADLADVHDPYLLDGMKEAVGRIRLALERGERIRIYGDYDADGVSSTSLMVRLMRRLGADFDYYIPHRVREGYGLNHAAVEETAAGGFGLIVTVDTGISAVEQVERARELGVDVVVTDHHEPPEVLPQAAAIVNPKKTGCPYPYKSLAGVGVAFKLAHALLGRLPEEWLDLVALGTIADLMPLDGENRIFVKHGLERISGTEQPGLRALLGVAGVSEGQPVTAGQVGFALGPRLNAGGRLEHAGDAVELLTTEDRETALRLADRLDALNRERQQIVEETTEEALAMWEEEAALGRRVAVLAREGWNVGVIGIVASKVLERAYRPTLILGIDPGTGTAKGSARSIPGFDIHKALTECADLLEHYGGHTAAAGLTIRTDRIPELRDRLDALARAWLREEDYTPLLKADGVRRLEDATLESIGQLERLAPFGMGNPSPRFVIKGVRIDGRRTMGKDNRHMKLTLLGEDGGCRVEAVGFQMAGLLPQLSQTAELDVLAEWSINEWNGKRSPQLVLQDLRVPHVQVFDWRGQRLEAKLGEWRDASRSQAILFASAHSVGPEALELLESAGASAWLARSRGSLPQEEALPEIAAAAELSAEADADGWLPLTRAAAARGGWTDCADIWWADMPESVDDLRASLGQWKSPERLYVSFIEPQSYGTFRIPDRETFKRLYAALLPAPEWNPDNPNHWEALARRVAVSVPALRFMVDVFLELGLLERRGGTIAAVRTADRRDFSESGLYRRQSHRDELDEVLVMSTGTELAGRLSGWISAGK
ncbi:single-stranded-DNA-specific exonuclease RecJ [Paenibacillus thermoaerophilus]|uniref:Single-stranded-DNA-specific exonuclease RecJ n=1 Tax=Paenibacillus thermoaerophilus TaxID=1215385 RepID=A0ABW2UZL5_9BACL|nr:single-stranded-DNA-specific exonuclease RecJ [Paenibacillus thermoaerophilus]TMV17315.1 single-stranded-DNA-specific exonuclease RecJ [Paenibacillus thermoaerophilus]